MVRARLLTVKNAAILGIHAGSCVADTRRAVRMHLSCSLWRLAASASISGAKSSPTTWRHPRHRRQYQPHVRPGAEVSATPQSIFDGGPPRLTSRLAVWPDRLRQPEGKVAAAAAHVQRRVPGRGAAPLDRGALPHPVQAQASGRRSAAGNTRRGIGSAAQGPMSSTRAQSHTASG